MALPLFIVDAFTDRPFAGNPAAVCLLDGPRPDAWLHNVAGEMNLSETAFLLPRQDGHSLRWFTPRVEVDLCGHATLASALVLFETGQLLPEQVARFHTRSGELQVRRKENDLEMDFPAVVARPCASPPDLAAALGTPVEEILQNGMDYLVLVASEAMVRGLKPDFAHLATLPVRGVIVTARGDGPHDFVSRFFAPRVGVPEDPVTGSAHCALGPFWQPRLGKADLLGYQASARGGTVRVGVRGDRVLLGGQGVIVVRGELTW